jgi:exodeoxyribonuclease VII large subunit
LRQLRLDRQVEQERDKLSWKHRQLLQVTTGKLQQADQHLEMLRQKLASIDPKSVLQRGYAVVITENGVIPRSVSELTIGENLVIQLAQGKVTVKVIEVTEG